MKRFRLEMTNTEKKLLVIPFTASLTLYLVSIHMNIPHPEVFLCCSLVLFPFFTGFLINRAWNSDFIKKIRKTGQFIADMSENEKKITQKGTHDIIKGHSDSEYARNLIRKCNKI